MRDFFSYFEKTFKLFLPIIIFIPTKEKETLLREYEKDKENFGENYALYI